jgi:hypothetical protein
MGLISELTISTRTHRNGDSGDGRSGTRRIIAAIRAQEWTCAPTAHASTTPGISKCSERGQFHGSPPPSRQARKDSEVEHVKWTTLRNRPGTPGSGPQWVKSSLSLSNGNCVEVADLPEGGIGIRDSKDPEGPVLRFTAGEWYAFLGGARNGEFDIIGVK